MTKGDQFYWEDKSLRKSLFLLKTRSDLKFSNNGLH